MENEVNPRLEKNKTIIEYRTHSEKTLEKQLVYISSSALGLTFFLTEKIVTIATSQYKYLLILSWSGFALTLLFNLFSQYTAVITADKVLDIEDSKITSNNYKSAKRWNQFTKGLQISSMFFLITGIVLFIIFISNNI